MTGCNQLYDSNIKKLFDDLNDLRTICCRLKLMSYRSNKKEQNNV